jgi:2-keto-4-pentenoate hydratase/2-oxohepta-3-ene-1,7-dioic acid hydratase in catechol pathway
MRLASYIWNNANHYGVVSEGRVYRLGSRIAEFLEQPAAPLPPGFSALPAAPLEEVKLLPPVPEPEKIICIGLNYADHARESGGEVPKYPVCFAKYRNALAGPADPIVLPRVSCRVDYEAELAVVIGRRGRYIAESDAMDCVAGYMAMNDVSARDYQFRTSQWLQGKTFDGFAPCGPFLVTCDEVPEPHSLGVRLRLNGELMQNSNTRELIFPIPRLISYLSGIMTLTPGDIISTGTPAGVGFARQPPVYLKPGDIVEVEIDRIGSIRNVVVAEM